MTKILVVDDEPGLRDMLCDALSIAGYETVAAADGYLAYRLLKDTKVDLIITDVNMPNMDGYEFLERIRSQGNETPAIVLTARGDRTDVSRGLKLGADDYVTKPFGLEELTLRVAAILRRTQAGLGAGSWPRAPRRRRPHCHPRWRNRRPLAHRIQTAARANEAPKQGGHQVTPARFGLGHELCQQRNSG